MARLTTKQELFVEAYVGPAAGNATEAARQAGYKGSDNTLASVGSENLRKPKIREAIDQRLAQVKQVMDADEVLRHLTEIGRDRDEKTKNRLRALETMAKVHGLSKERVDVHHTGQVKLTADRLAELSQKADEELDGWEPRFADSSG